MNASTLQFHQRAVRHLVGLVEAYREWVRQQEKVFDASPDAEAVREITARQQQASGSPRRTS